MKAALFSLAMIFIMVISNDAQADLWSLDGTEIYDENGDPTTIRAFTIYFGMLRPTWIVYDENGYAETHEDNKRLQAQWDYRIDPVSLKILKDNGFNVVRWMVAYHLLMPHYLQDPVQEDWVFAESRYYDHPESTALSDLGYIIDMIGDSGLKTILCITRFPGGANAQDRCDMCDTDDELHFFDKDGCTNDDWDDDGNIVEPGVGTIYYATKFQKMFFWMWERIAEYFVGDEDIAAFETTNEAHFYLYNIDGDPYEWTVNEGLSDVGWSQMDVWYKILETRIYDAETEAEAQAGHHIVCRQVPFSRHFLFM